MAPGISLGSWRKRLEAADALADVFGGYLANLPEAGVPDEKPRAWAPDMWAKIGKSLGRRGLAGPRGRSERSLVLAVSTVAMFNGSRIFWAGFTSAARRGCPAIFTGPVDLFWCSRLGLGLRPAELGRSRRVSVTQFRPIWPGISF